MEDLKSAAFALAAIIDNQKTNIKVQPKENSDGVSFYFCEVDGEKISQLRKEGAEWQQVWGTLLQHEVKQLGKQIENHLNS